MNGCWTKQKIGCLLEEVTGMKRRERLLWQRVTKQQRVPDPLGSLLLVDHAVTETVRRKTAVAALFAEKIQTELSIFHWTMLVFKR